MLQEVEKMKVSLFSAKEAKFLALTSMFASGVCIAGAISDAYDGFPIWQSIFNLLISAFCMAVSLYAFDEYSSQLEEEKT